MTIGGKILGELQDWVVLAIFIVVGSLILLKFKAVDGMTSGLNSTVDTFVSAIGEPKNWVAIVIIAAVGFGIFGYMKLKK